MAKLTYLSHSAWKIDAQPHTILIDPFLDGNPLSPVKAKDVRADFIFITHAHGDHLGDAVAIAKASNGLIISNYEIANYCQNQGAKTHPMHIGGSHAFPFGSIKLTPAFHGSSFPDGSYGGMPTGVVIHVAGKNIYHAGDTGVFSDMRLISELTPIDIALLPIGDNFTMGITDAVKAVELLRPKKVIPMHYNTFPVIETDPHDFRKKVEAMGISVQVLGFGASTEF